MSASFERAPAAPSSALAFIRDAIEYSFIFTFCIAVIGAAFGLFSFDAWSMLLMVMVAFSVVKLYEHVDTLHLDSEAKQPLLVVLLWPQVLALAPLCGLYAVLIAGDVAWLKGVTAAVLWVSLLLLAGTLLFYTSSGRTLVAGMLAIGMFLLSLLVLALYSVAALIFMAISAARAVMRPPGSEKSVVWLGDNAVEVVDVLGHHRFTHKTGTLFIDDGDGLVVEVPYGARLTRSRYGVLTVSGGLLSSGQVA
jgi:hypothetical protein